MKIYKLNPAGYESQTPQGNKYKKSNIAKTALIGTMAAIDASPYIVKNNNVAKLLSTGELLKDVAKIFKINISPKMVKPIVAIGIVLDLLFAYGIGKAIDDRINNKRITKADAKTDEK